MKTKKIYIVILIIIITMLSKVYAAGSFSVSASSTSIYVGNTTTLTIKTSDCAGKFTVTSSNSSVATVSSSSVWVDGTTTVTIAAKANGTANIVVMTQDVSDIDLNDVKGSKSVTVTVSTKQTSTSNNTSSAKPNTSTSSKPSSSNTSTSNKVNNKTNTQTSVQSTLSNNAYLKEFRVDIPGITPDFNKNTFNYALTVEESVNNLSVTAVPEDSKASVSISGNTNLNLGENTINVKVTAEDKKTTKTYTINVTKVQDVQKSNAFLQNIIVTDIEMSPSFSKEIFEYDLGSVTSDRITLSAFAENENATVQIEGNENLVLGENLIKITVTSENGNVNKTYTLKVIKEEENVAETEPESADKTFRKAKLANMKAILKEKAGVILLYFMVWIEFIQVIYLYEKQNK